MGNVGPGQSHRCSSPVLLASTETVRCGGCPLLVASTETVVRRRSRVVSRSSMNPWDRALWYEPCLSEQDDQGRLVPIHDGHGQVSPCRHDAPRRVRALQQHSARAGCAAFPSNPRCKRLSFCPGPPCPHRLERAFGWAPCESASHAPRFKKLGKAGGARPSEKALRAPGETHSAILQGNGPVWYRR